MQSFEAYSGLTPAMTSFPSLTPHSADASAPPLYSRNFLEKHLRLGYL